MRRRSFLSFLGLATVAAALGLRLPVGEAMAEASAPLSLGASDFTTIPGGLIESGTIRASSISCDTIAAGLDLREWAWNGRQLERRVMPESVFLGFGA